MSESYLNAHYGVCIGGIFFKEGDKVKVEGKGYSSKKNMKATGLITDLNFGILTILRSDYCHVSFDIYSISRLEHVKEEGNGN